MTSKIDIIKKVMTRTIDGTEDAYLKQIFEYELNQSLEGQVFIRDFNKSLDTETKKTVEGITEYVLNDSVVKVGKYYALRTLNSDGLTGIANIAAINKTAAIEHFQQENPGTAIESITELCDGEWEVDNEN